MDVSIAVSLIRGQMGAVVERAVNGAVETVLAEMLKVVGVKFEELKAQVALMKRDVVALQREKALKEKENDNIRAKLRYTELKLKYYRQGVEEELQQRASAQVHIHPSTFVQTQRVKQEAEEVICIKEEPEDEQEAMSTPLLDFQGQQGPLQESEPQRSVTEWSGLPGVQRSPAANTYPLPQPATSLPSMPPSASPHQAVRPWTKDLSLYEEYKLRRNELRRRSVHRRRELEKTLPQPLLADLVRERREKTRLRVARWRAKRKLQACLNQAQALGGAAGLSQTGFPVGGQHQQLRVLCAASSSSQRQTSPSSSFLDTALPFTPPASSASLPSLKGANMTLCQHTVTSSSASYAQAGLSQDSVSLTDTDVVQ